MTVLLTGGAGYIGSHTAVELLLNDIDVIIVDNYSNSHTQVINRLYQITGKKVKTYNIDVKDRQALNTVFEQNQIDIVIHFAGMKAVGESVVIPLKYYRNNIDSTLTLLEVMSEYNVNNIIFSSSAAVYGIPERVPITEDMPTSCTNPYGWTKFMIEQILTDTSQANKNLSVVLLRYFNPIGAHESGLIGEDPKGIPNNLFPYITQVAAGKLEYLNIYGNDYPTKDGTGVRDYIHVVDLAKGHVSALNYVINHKGVEIFNIGTGVGYSVLDIVNAFQRVNKMEIPYKIIGRRTGDIAECYADCSKANKILGWKAEKSIQDMCKDAWRWQVNNLNGYEEKYKIDKTTKIIPVNV